MRPEDKYPGIGCETQGQCARERASSILRHRARQMHEEAVRLESLADFAANLGGDAEEALWRLVIKP